MKSYHRFRKFLSEKGLEYYFDEDGGYHVLRGFNRVIATISKEEVWRGFDEKAEQRIIELIRLDKIFDIMS